MAITAIKDKDKDHLVFGECRGLLRSGWFQDTGQARLSLPSFFLFFRSANFSRAFFFPHYLRAWNRLSCKGPMHLVPIAAIFSVSATDCQALFGSRIRRKIDCKLNDSFFSQIVFFKLRSVRVSHAWGASLSRPRISRISN